MSVTRAISVLALAVAAGCSGGGGGGGVASSAIAPATSAVPTVPMNVSLAANSTSVHVGDSIDVVLTASQVSSLYGAGLDLAFDPTLVDFQSASDGGFVPSATVGAGKNGAVVTIAASAEGASSGATGSGDVFVVRFVAKATGAATIAPSSLILEDAAGNQGASAPLAPISVTIR